MSRSFLIPHLFLDFIGTFENKSKASWVIQEKDLAFKYTHLSNTFFCCKSFGNFDKSKQLNIDFSVNHCEFDLNSRYVFAENFRIKKCLKLKKVIFWQKI